MPMAAKYIAPVEEVPVEESLAEEQQATSIEEQVASADETVGSAKPQAAPVQESAVAGGTSTTADDGESVRNPVARPEELRLL